MLAPEGMMCAVKLDKIADFATGDIADEDIIYIEEADTEGKYVGTEVEIEFNADKTVKSFKSTGKSVVGALTITKEGDKFTAKIGDKVFLDNADATAKLAEKAYDAIDASGYYVSKATMKSVFALNSAENFDLQTCFGDDTRDVTTVGLFYDEFYNFTYEGGIDGYDWDGDGKLDLVVVNRPHTVKATADSDGTSVSFGVLGDNHSYCGCGGYHTQTTISNGTIAAGIIKNDVLFVYEDYKTGTYNVTKPEVIVGTLTSYDSATGKVVVGDKTYQLYVEGDLPYVNNKNVTLSYREDYQAKWANTVGLEVKLCADKFGNIIWADGLATEAAIVDAAWALEKGATLGNHTLTGVITSVDNAYSEQYKNITVTIVVGDKSDKPIVCYRVKGEGIEGLAVGDTITVFGELLRYADKSETGLVEFNSTAVVTNIVKGEAPAVHTHTWDAGKVTKEASCKEAGVKTFTCTLCGKIKTESVSKLPENLKPGLSQDGKTFVGVLDMTDYYTLVIEKVGQSGDSRMPVRAAAGKVQIATYNAAGKKRTASYEIDFSALGVSGYAWEYLGATVVLDVSDISNVKVIDPPKKTTYCVSISEMTFPNATTVKMPDGTEFNLGSMNWGGLSNTYLINEGGWFIPGWNDTSIINSSSGMFTNSNFSSGYYIICGCALYNENVMYGGLTYSLHEYPTEAPNS